MKYVIIDHRASVKTADALEKYGFNVIFTPKLDHVYTTICGHSDIMVHKLCDDAIVAEPTVADYFKDKMPGIEVIKGETILKDKYPYDIAYNAARIGNNIVCNKNFTDAKIIEFANKNNINLLNTKQGYSKCSICVVSDEAVITSDKNIQSVLNKNNVDVLMVDDSKIKLKNFDHGFIGGATGLLNENTLAVNGNIELHTNYKEIIAFAKKHGVEVISLNNDEIIDIGTIITLQVV